MTSLFDKLSSRKFAITVATIISTFLKVDDPRIASGVAAAVGIAYVVMEALLDKARVERVATSLEFGIEEARKQTE